MKQKLLLLVLLTFSIGFANPKVKTTTNPAIGIMMYATNTGGMVIYNISIKNTGDEVLTDIIVLANDIQLNFSTIASLAPGEEVTGLVGFKNGTFCFDQSQVLVTATASTTNTQISDFSSDPYGYDNNGLPGSYYNDSTTTSVYLIISMVPNRALMLMPITIPS